MSQDEIPNPQAPAPPEPATPIRTSPARGHVVSDGIAMTKVTVDGVDVAATEVTWRQRAGEVPRMIVEVPLTSADLQGEVEVIKPLSPGGAGRAIAWVRSKLAGCLRAIAGLLEGRIAPP